MLRAVRSRCTRSPAIRLAFAIGAENRHAEWIHFQLMQRSCEPLVRLCFADSGWPAGRRRRPRADAPSTTSGPRPPHRGPRGSGHVSSYRGRLARRTRQPTTPPCPSRTVEVDRRTDTEALDLALMRRYLLDDPSARHFELFDREAVQQSLDRFAGLGESKKAQLYGALTAAIWLGGHEIALPRGIGYAS